MEVKDLCSLELGSYVQAMFENYWSQANYPIKISSTWASDLCIAMYYQKNGPEKHAISQTVDDGWECWKTDFDMASQLIMATNFLCWFCYENECYKDFSKEFSRHYYSLLLQAEKVMSDAELNKLYEILN